MTDDERTAYIEACPAFGLDEKGESAFDMSTEECQLCEQQDRNTHNACWEEWKQANPPQAQEVGEPQVKMTVEDNGAEIPEAPKPEKEKQEMAETEKKTKVVKETKEKKMSQLDAAVVILGEADGPLNCKEMVSRMAEKGLWSSPKGKTPAATVNAAIIREINKKGDESRFRKVSRGMFSLNG
ncbi:hypothetical protein LCGC14_0235050 [marine sediment metagenome]|uniref:HTH HARE-type domain-containing protein n=1 Tax=marine sediment metagenome TaxID=412755 RepID=A0A0F9UDB6_9ZZZZ